jgi:hypothetical protein
MTAEAPGLDTILMRNAADLAMGWAAMEPVARAFFAVGVGGALALLWLGLARQLDRSALIWRPSRGFALGLAAALIVPRLLPPALTAILADRIGPYLWAHARIVDGAGLAAGAVVAVTLAALARQRWRRLRAA